MRLDTDQPSLIDLPLRIGQQIGRQPRQQVLQARLSGAADHTGGQLTIQHRRKLFITRPVQRVATASVGLPALIRLHQHPRAPGPPVPYQPVELLFGHHLQALDSAGAQGAGQVRGQVLLALGSQGLLAVLQQVANVEQLQQPATALRQQPAAGVQGTPASRLEIQFQWLALPVWRLAFEHQQAVGLHVVVQTHAGLGRQRQHRAQRACQA
ncbi:hypothetical protein D3C80_502050 [compost metagenome]